MNLDHITINVSDLEASTAFYCEGLGCKHVGEEWYEEPAELNTSLVEGRHRVLSRFLETGNDLRLVLNLTDVPKGPLPPYRRQYGLTNLAVRVADIDAAVAKLLECGGQVVERSRQSFRLETGRVHVIVCLDPDGQPVELIASSED